MKSAVFIKCLWCLSNISNFITCINMSFAFRISQILCPLNTAVLPASCKSSFICSLANLRLFFALRKPHVRYTFCIQSSDIDKRQLTLPIHPTSSSVSGETSFSVYHCSNIIIYKALLQLTSFSLWTMQRLSLSSCTNLLKRLRCGIPHVFLQHTIKEYHSSKHNFNVATTDCSLIQVTIISQSVDEISSTDHM